MLFLDVSKKQIRLNVKWVPVVNYLKHLFKLKLLSHWTRGRVWWLCGRAAGVCGRRAEKKTKINYKHILLLITRRLFLPAQDSGQMASWRGGWRLQMNKGARVLENQADDGERRRCDYAERCNTTDKCCSSVVLKHCRTVEHVLSSVFSWEWESCAHSHALSHRHDYHQRMELN